MFLVNQQHVDGTLREDVVDRWLDRYSNAEHEQWVCQRWLRQTPAKRFIFHHMYGDLLAPDARGMRVLDVGGGLTAFTAELARRHDYCLIELLAHDDADMVATMHANAGRAFVSLGDWAADKPGLATGPFDLVIANDLFPNVDQRLDMFLQRFLPQARRIRLSLTYYDTPRYYMTRRVDAQELFCVLAWDNRQLRSVLERHAHRIVQPAMEVFSRAPASVFPNGRQVCMVEFDGALDQARS